MIQILNNVIATHIFAPWENYVSTLNLNLPTFYMRTHHCLFVLHENTSLVILHENTSNWHLPSHIFCVSVNAMVCNCTIIYYIMSFIFVYWIKVPFGDVSDKLPYSIRILLESAIRNCDNFQVTTNDVEKIIDWENTSPKLAEIPFKPARVLLQVYIATSQMIFSISKCPLLTIVIISLGLHWSSSCCWSRSYAWCNGQVGKWCQQDQPIGM
jgi:hypothetical protein